MKKLLFTFGLMITAFATFAQNFGDNDRTITIGVAGGENFAFLQVASPHRQEVWTDAENPFSLGVTFDFKSNPHFSIRPGVFYSGRGGSLNPIYVDDQGNNVSVLDEYRLHYLELSVPVIGHLPFRSGANVFIGAGPYYAYGLNGTNKQTISSDDAVTQKITFGGNGDFKRNDLGVATVLGFESASGFSVSGNLDFGLTNIMQNNTTGFDASSLKTITFYISIGRRF